MSGKLFTILYNNKRQHPAGCSSMPDQIPLEGAAASMNATYDNAFEQAHQGSRTDAEILNNLAVISEECQKLSLKASKTNKNSL